MLIATAGPLLLLVGVLAGCGGMAFRAELGMRRLTHQRFIVTVHGDLPFVGNLTHRGRRTYIFEACHTLASPGETAVPIAGRVVIDRESIAYMQHVVTGIDLPPAPYAKGPDVPE